MNLDPKTIRKLGASLDDAVKGRVITVVTVELREDDNKSPAIPVSIFVVACPLLAAHVEAVISRHAKEVKERNATNS
jgi:hypothetical protein